jgi:NAD(P)-dependent dehydrogenase (short-subunit alcohol dehydrogenase family)
MADRQPTALITGASSGIGLKIVELCIKANFLVCAVGRSESKLRSALADAGVDTRNVRFVIADLANAAECQRAASEALALFGGKLDALINNAGGAVLGQAWGAASVDAYDWTMAINVRAPFILTNACVDALAAVEGSVINMSSVAAARPFAGLGPYNAAKAAVEMLTKSAALELAPRHIRVNAIAPGTVATHFHESAGMDSSIARAYYTASAGTHPLGRVGSADDIAFMAMFLLNKAHSGWVTGSIMTVDGGRLLTSATAPQLAGSK